MTGASTEAIDEITIQMDDSEWHNVTWHFIIGGAAAALSMY